MKTLKAIFSALFAFLRSDQAKRDFQLALKYAPMAIPYIQALTPIIAAAVPAAGPIGAAIVAFAQRYPDLFDQAATEERKKAAALRVAAELLQKDHPQLSTSIAILAVQMNFIGVQQNAAK